MCENFNTNGKKCRRYAHNIPKDDQELLEAFKCEFNKIDPTSCKEFNRKRSDTFPEWQTVAARFGFTKWSDLIELSGLYLASLDKKTPDELLAIFIKEFNRIKPSSCDEYDLKRKDGTLGWMGIAHSFGITKWTDLVKLAGVKIAPRKAARPAHKEVHIIVISHHDIGDFSDMQPWLYINKHGKK